MDADKPCPAVSFRGVTKRYGAVAALDGIDVEIASGSFVALVGGSGSGKSTLIRTINRLVDPDAGTVAIDGTDVRTGAAHLLRRRIGHVIQSTGLFPHLSVGANIGIGLRIAGTRDTNARVAELLDLVGLPQDFAGRLPATLSGGQAQRVGVARALATAPRLMLLDEPFGALDPVTRDAIGKAYRGLHERLGLTSILVTHDMAEALLLADRVLVLSGGRIVADATARRTAARRGRCGSAGAGFGAEGPGRAAGGARRVIAGELLGRLLPLVAAHVLIASAALALGLVLALPLGVLAARHPRFGQAVLGFASLVQTIPSLALLALFFPLLLAVKSLTGAAISPLGFLPALLALTLYALLPIVRNTVVALRGIDPDLIEAADGIGMTRAQKLRLVEAPLALPTVMAGIRTAAVWTIGAATLSTTVGQPSLGDVIFSGLTTQNWSLVVAGCLASAALALAADALLALAERGIARGPRLLWIAALALFVAAPVVALVSQFRPAQPTVIIGAKSFGEQFILARVIGHRLEAAGYRVTYKENLGSAVVFGAVAGGQIDVYVDYAGTLWTNEMKRADNPPRAAMVSGVADWAKRERGVTMLGALGFENAYALAMRGDAAHARHITSIADLTRAAPALTLGADLEFLDRPEWATIRRAYDLRFAATRTFNPGFMYGALQSRDADVISAFSSDGRIAADGLVVLTDPKGAIPSYDALLMIGAKPARDARLVAALRPLVGRIPVATMQRANLMVDRADAKASPDDAARWLERAIGL